MNWTKLAMQDETTGGLAAWLLSSGGIATAFIVVLLLGIVLGAIIFRIQQHFAPPQPDTEEDDNA